MRSLNASTVAAYSYTQTWLSLLDQSHAVIEVLACGDAHILLSDRLDGWHAGYEVVLGINGNTQSVIRDAAQGRDMVVMETPHIMSCDQYRLEGCYFVKSQQFRLSCINIKHYLTFMNVSRNEGSYFEIH